MQDKRMSDRLSIEREDLEAMLARAAEAGASAALKRVGLDDEKAAKDIGEARSLLDSYRLAKRTVTKAFFHWLTIGILSLIVAGAVTHFNSTK